MKTKLSAVFFAFVLIIVSILSCKKEYAKDELLTVDEYKKISLATINKLPNSYVQHRSSSEENFPTIREQDFHNTFIHEQLNSNNEIIKAYATPIIRDNEQVAEIVGYLVPDRRILNIVYTYEQLETNYWKLNVYYIDGTKIGIYKIREGIVEDVTVEPEGEEGTPAEQARSWWGCTKECVSDAHIACYMDKHCMTMLLIANVGGTGTSFGGQGSLSISVACGIACAGNRNLDLLPQY